MRSRDGNYYRSLAIYSVIFFNSLILSADEYYISYRYVVKDATLFNENLQVSHAMKPCVGTTSSFIQLFTDESKNLLTIINTNSEKFINYLHKIGLNLEYISLMSNYKHSSVSIHTLKTTCFKVDFNDNFVKISPIN